jgi:hypothetical protein
VISRRWLPFLFAVSFCFFPIQSGDVMMYLNIARDYILEGEWRQLDVHQYLYPATDGQLHWHHEYLSSFIFYMAWWLGAWKGLIFFKAALVGTAAWIAARSEQEDSGPWWAALWALAVLAASFRFIERSSLFSDLLTVLILALLLKKRRLTNRLLIQLIVIFWLWIQLHPGFPLGFGLLGLWMFWNRQWSWRLGLIPAVMLANPDFAEGLLYPFRFAFSEGQVFRSYNYEWLPAIREPFVFSREVLAFWFLSATATWFLIRAKAWREISAALFMFLMAANAVRFLPSAALVIAYCTKPYLPRTFPRARPFALAILAMIALKNISWGYSSSAGFRPAGFGLDPSVFPSKTLEILRQLPKTKIYNSHDFGAYLIWLGIKPVFHHGFVTDMAFYKNEVIGGLSSPERFFALAEKYRWQVLLVDRNSAYRAASSHPLPPPGLENRGGRCGGLFNCPPASRTMKNLQRTCREMSFRGITHNVI